MSGPAQVMARIGAIQQRMAAITGPRPPGGFQAALDRATAPTPVEDGTDAGPAARSRRDTTEGDAVVVAPGREHLDGLLVDRAVWLLRPGDLVPVRFSIGAAPRGLYVPVSAIATLNDAFYVLVVDGDRARRVTVTVHDAVAELRRIEGAGLQPGTRLVASGLQLAADGERIVVVGEQTY